MSELLRTLPGISKEKDSGGECTEGSEAVTNVACPCCGALTLDERGIFDICPVCDWEDDGQDDADADVVRGGPNGPLSLTEARRLFRVRQGKVL